MHPFYFWCRVYEGRSMLAAASSVAAVLNKFKAKAGPDVKRVGVVVVWHKPTVPKE